MIKFCQIILLFSMLLSQTLEEAYQEVARRLGILPEMNLTEADGPRLVK